MSSTHYSLFNVYEREALVVHMSGKHAHVASLRKRIKDKIRRRNLRHAFLLHVCTFILVAMYLQELVSNKGLLAANHGMLQFIQRTSFQHTTKSGHKHAMHVKNVGDVATLEKWIREVALKKLLVESTPYYYTIENGVDNRTSTNATTAQAEISTRQFYGKYLLLWGFRLRQLRVKPIDRAANDQLLQHACLVHRKTNENFYDIDYSISAFGKKTYG